MQVAASSGALVLLARFRAALRYPERCWGHVYFVLGRARGTTAAGLPSAGGCPASRQSRGTQGAWARPAPPRVGVGVEVGSAVSLVCLWSDVATGSGAVCGTGSQKETCVLSVMSF